MKLEYLEKNSTIFNAFSKFNKLGLKTLVVSDKSKKLLGVLSDGDLRRAILKNNNLSTKINKFYNKKPFFLTENEFSNQRCRELFLKQELEIIPIVSKNKTIIKIITWSEFFSKKKQVISKIDIDVVIMSGGKGTRLKPFSNILPKPLMPINNRPIIELIIEKFIENGCNNFFLTLHYKSELIKAFFQELKPNYKINFIKENKQLGTIGGLALIKNKIQKNKENIFVVNCDVLHNFNYFEFYNHHIKNNFDITLVASTKSFKIPYGVCEINQKGYLKNMREKPEQNFLVNTGFYILKRKVISLIPKNKNFDLTDLIKLAKNKGFKVGVFPIDDHNWTDIGQIDNYFQSLKNEN
tara:strand:+ start:6042 stop:7100 length:1059 start_codon:yes stop_codon:yes gene_type:complete